MAIHPGPWLVLVLPVVLEAAVLKECSKSCTRHSDTLVDCPQMLISTQDSKDDIILEFKLTDSESHDLQLQPKNNNYLELIKCLFANLTRLTISNLDSIKMKTLDFGILSNRSKLSVLKLLNTNVDKLPNNMLGGTKLKEFFMLGNKGPLLKLPKKLFSDQGYLQTIYISESNLISIPEEAFTKCKRTENLSLSHNKLKILYESTFEGLESLKYLDLSHNEIKDLHKLLFFYVVNLETLSLRHNRLEVLQNFLFGHLVKLTSLDLSHNSITAIQEEQFTQVRSLQRLDISSNRLHSLRYADYLTYQQDFSALFLCAELRHLQLSNNSLTEFHEDWRLHLSHLETLNLSYNKFSGYLVKELPTRAVDTFIDLSHNAISAISLLTVRRAQLLDLSFNPLNCNCDLLLYSHIMKETLQSRNANYKDFKCNTPIHFRNQTVDSVVERGMRGCCTESLSERSGCPEQCQCRVCPTNGSSVVSCSKCPVRVQLHSQWGEFADHTELRLLHSELEEFHLNRILGYKNITHLVLGSALSSLDIDGASKKLKVLDISNNSLTALSEGTMDVLERSGELEHLGLAGNPWICDCRTKRLIDFVKTNQHKINQLVKCRDNKPMEEVVLFCWAEVLMTSYVLVGPVLTLLLVLALLAALLYRRYRLQVHVCCYSSRWRTLRWAATRPDHDDDPGKEFDAFVSFSHDDESFVAEQLVPFLEQTQERKFKLCLHYRDWVPGEVIPAQIASSVRRSRRTVVVLSPSFLRSVWGVLEFRTAHCVALSEGGTKVIVILYQEVGPRDRLPEEIRDYLQMNTCLLWGSTWFWRQLVYSMPHTARY